MSRSLIILGAGTFAVEVLEIVELSSKWPCSGFCVSDMASAPANHEGLPVVHVDGLPPPADVWLVAGIVSTRRRNMIASLMSLGYEFVAVVHPSAVISRRARVDAGAVIGAGVIVASHTSVGAHVVLNRGANIGHDNRLEPFATIGPGATLAGAVTIGPGAYVGVGATVRDHLDVGDGAVVAAGAVVVKPVEAHTLVAGCPAQVVKRGVDGL